MQQKLNKVQICTLHYLLSNKSLVNILECLAAKERHIFFEVGEKNIKLQMNLNVPHCLRDV